MALNYYRLLGIPPDADQQRIKSVYRSLAKRFHPDANKGSEAAAELFRQVNHAYQILSTPELRTRYDRELANNKGKGAGERTKETGAEPQQKFNKFISSLLDALFGPMGGGPAQNKRPGEQSRVKKSREIHTQPTFNFYYHLARKKNSAPYICGADGIYRKGPTTQAKTTIKPKRGKQPCG